MKFIYAEYYMYHNGVAVIIFDGYTLRIDSNVAEDGLRTTPCSQSLAIYNLFCLQLLI